MNDAFRDSNNFEMRQNANDGDDTVDDRVDGDVNDTDPDDFYANKESESLETNLSHLILIDYL
jgi:hypothetical protein